MADETNQELRRQLWESEKREFKEAILKEARAEAQGMFAIKLTQTIVFAFVSLICTGVVVSVVYVATEFIKNFAK